MEVQLLLARHLCILKTYWFIFLVLFVLLFSWFHRIVSLNTHSLQWIKPVLFFSSICLPLILSLTLLQWLENKMWSRNPCPVLDIGRESIQSFISKCLNCRFYIDAFCQVEEFPSILECWEYSGGSRLTSNWSPLLLIFIPRPLSSHLPCKLSFSVSMVLPSGIFPSCDDRKFPELLSFIPWRFWSAWFTVSFQHHTCHYSWWFWYPCSDPFKT